MCTFPFLEQKNDNEDKYTGITPQRASTSSYYSPESQISLTSLMARFNSLFHERTSPPWRKVRYVFSSPRALTRAPAQHRRTQKQTTRIYTCTPRSFSGRNRPAAEASKIDMNPTHTWQNNNRRAPLRSTYSIDIPF